MVVATGKIMSRQDPEVGGHKKLAAKIFCVTKRRNHVGTQLILLHHSSVATVSKSIITKLK